MIYFWRIICVFSILNLINLLVYDGGAGMEPVWMVIILISLMLSFRQPYQFVFSKAWLKAIVLIGTSIFILVEACIITAGLQSAMNLESDYIIVLGARVKGETPSLALQHRLDKAYAYMEKHPDVICILSGGQGKGEQITEAVAMKRYLLKKGVLESRLILEEESTNTRENLTNSFQIIDKNDVDANVIVITSRFHIFRSKIIANELGKKVSGIGSDTLVFLIPNYYLREFFAVIKEIIL